ncbi:MAG: type I-E CRISPR-associated protein Cas5/CasD [Chloroflexi bacterium]|nr:MAG: type I-E CRISPR-associated protein Cas5/CasD [Chloroflexota bacterium]
MPTLLLQCVAPLQAWGTQSNFTVRDTGREPSKSGIIGLLCAALGRPRHEPVDDLAALRLGVRVDREGQILRDFHTAGQGGLVKGFLRADGKGISKGTIISNRYYLADAMFLVGLEGKEDEMPLLQTLQNALSNPRWMLFLGRKACPPARPVYLKDGLQDKPLREALEEYPWLGPDEKYETFFKEKRSLRLVLEDPAGPDMKKDKPLSFVKERRRFALRRFTTTFMKKPPPRRQAVQTKEEMP